MPDRDAQQTAGPAASRDGRGAAGQQAKSARGGSDATRQGAMREVSDAMQKAAGDLRRGSPDQAGANASRALGALRDLERQLQSSPTDRDRARGEARLEARQL